MKVGSLFSGIGGIDLGLEQAGMSVRWQVENNSFCQRVLKKHWPDVPCYGDITAVDWNEVEPVDLVAGGFPCQPFSIAGKQRGQNDKRYLWPEVVRCLQSLKPTWFLGENVPGIVNLALPQVVADLESLNYQVWIATIPACGLDAPHVRQRIWICAYANSKGQPTVSFDEQRALSWAMDGAYPDAGRCEELRGQEPSEQHEEGTVPGTQRFRGYKSGRTAWETQPELCRVVDGVPNRVDRLKGLGNAVVPQVAEVLGAMLMRANRRHHELRSRPLSVRDSEESAS